MSQPVSHIKLISWNINGWYENSRHIREAIINGIKPHIAILSETHLKNINDTIDIENYTCLSNPRVLRHLRAKRNYGGVCVLIHDDVKQYYDFCVVDKTYDGVIAVKFNCKLSDYCFLVVGLYLSPELSTWGRDASGFYDHLLQLMYEHSNADNIILGGDLNSKLGSLQDFIPDVDNVPPRTILDSTKNRHGDELFNFLMEANMCVCNGRVTPQLNEYTYIHARGKSVIDYFIVPCDTLDQCINFRIQTVKDLMDEHCSANAEDLELRNIPDHSVLSLTIATQVNVQDCNPSAIEQGTQINGLNANSHENITNDDIYYKRFNVSNLPNNFLGREETRTEIVKLIDDIHVTRKNQGEIDDIYSRFCLLYHNEMKSLLKCKTIYPSTGKGRNRKTKPYWNDSLTQMWQDVCDKEKKYLKAQGNTRQMLRHEYIIAQKGFDKCYRKIKRNYQKNVVQDIENFSKLNPTEFWNRIKKLGPRKCNRIPMEVYNEQNIVDRNVRNVLEKWRTDFKSVYSYTPRDDEFDENFYIETSEALSATNFEELDGLNHGISYLEVQRVVRQASNNKAIGLDNLPYEVFKNNQSQELLTCLFNKIFEYGLTPQQWNLAIIKPIPKNSLIDPRLPLEYRGISLLSTVYKLLTSIINNRIVSVAEANGLYVDEQNGFRKQRSCEEHLFSLTSIIRNRKRDRKSTYVAFVDYEKAFDRVDRTLLFYKLKKLGFGGKILQCIQSLYSECKAIVNINGFLTNSFEVNCGVRQGDTLSPTLFGLFINDLVEDLKSTGKGIQLKEDLSVSSLLYADDLAILAETEEGLQMQLKKLESWCKKWRMRVNIKKTKVVHFRTKSVDKTRFKFELNGQEVECVDRYKYLGIFLNEFLDFNSTASVLANSASRALGSICSKFKKVNGFRFATFTKLFDTGVAPILDYASSIWGYQGYTQIESIQNKAVRFFLGVHRFACNYAINGDTGWVPANVRRKINMLRFWNRMINCSEERLTKKIFMWDVVTRKHSGTWSSDIFKVLTEIDCVNSFECRTSVNLDVAKQKLFENFRRTWENGIMNTPKLRTYCKFKSSYETEPHVIMIHNRKERSLISQFRCGTLPLKVETGRFTQIPLELRLCLLCDNDSVEDECHFFFDCNYYHNYRQNFISKVKEIYPNFENLDREEKLVLCMNNSLIKLTAKFICECFTERQKAIFN